MEPALRRYAHVVHRTAKRVTSPRTKNESIFKISKNACKSTVFHCHICKFVGVFAAVVIVVAQPPPDKRNAVTRKHEHAQNPRPRKNYFRHRVPYELIACGDNRPFSLCTFCFPNTNYVIILRGIGPLFCSLKTAHASMNMRVCTLFNEQNKGPNLLSIST